MHIIQALCVAATGLASIGLDIVSFFVVIRFITLRWRFRPLLAFDQVGKPLVDPLVAAVQRAMPVGWLGLESRRTQWTIAAALLVVAICRLACGALTHVVIIP
jgi:hypothetical protein